MIFRFSDDRRWRRFVEWIFAYKKEENATERNDILIKFFLDLGRDEELIRRNN